MKTAHMLSPPTTLEARPANSTAVVFARPALRDSAPGARRAGSSADGDRHFKTLAAAVKAPRVGRWIIVANAVWLKNLSRLSVPVARHKPVLGLPAAA